MRSRGHAGPLIWRRRIGVGEGRDYGWIIQYADMRGPLTGGGDTSRALPLHPQLECSDPTTRLWISNARVGHIRYWIAYFVCIADVSWDRNQLGPNRDSRSPLHLQIVPVVYNPATIDWRRTTHFAR